MKLIIKGDANKIKRLEKELRLRFKRDKLKASIKGGEEKPKAETNTNTGSSEPVHWSTVVAAVKEVETLEDLKQYETDERTSVKNAVEAKKQELSNQ